MACYLIIMQKKIKNTIKAVAALLEGAGVDLGMLPYWYATGDGAAGTRILAIAYERGVDIASLYPE